MRGKSPNTTMLPPLGNQRARLKCMGKNDLALQLFFFFSSSRQLLRFDFNAFCVVLYFHAKILMYLNVFILLNVFFFFFSFWLFPRIAVIILMSQYLTSFCERDLKKREENTKHFLQQCWLIYSCNTVKMDAEVCFHKTCLLLFWYYPALDDNFISSLPVMQHKFMTS